MHYAFHILLLVVFFILNDDCVWTYKLFKDHCIRSERLHWEQLVYYTLTKNSLTFTASYAEISWVPAMLHSSILGNASSSVQISINKITYIRWWYHMHRYIAIPNMNIQTNLSEKVSCMPLQRLHYTIVFAQRDMCSGFNKSKQLKSRVSCTKKVLLKLCMSSFGSAMNETELHFPTWDYRSLF